MTLTKAVTCHAGARDGYHLSAALHSIGALEKLVTDLYMPTLLQGFFTGRHNADLPSSKTESMFWNFLREKTLNENFLFTDKILSQKAFNVAKKEKSNFFLTSYTAFEAFNNAINEGLHSSRLLFQIHPHPMTVRRILSEELCYTPEAEFSIRAEHEMNASKEMLFRLDQESHLASSILVASSFTKESLVENGISADKVTVLPYGVDSVRFARKLNYSKNNGPIKVLFVGQMVQRKGLSYLLEALKRLKSEHVELTIVGRGRIDEVLLDAYRPFVSFNVINGLSHIALIECFHSNDVMVLPSLIEGFGHVILEAMSAGLPVVCTKNTAGPDLFLSGNEGIVVPIRDSDAIARSIEDLALDKLKLEIMGTSAAETARQFTWTKHIDGIKDFYIKHS